MKKGFTLVEMMGVIVLLAIVGMIVFPEVNKVIKNSRAKLYDEQIGNLIKVTKEYVLYNTELLPEVGQTSCISLDDLKVSGKISSDDIIDPRNREQIIDGFIVITYSEDYNQYNYEFNEVCQANMSINND